MSRENAHFVNKKQGPRKAILDVKELAILTSRIGQSWSPGLKFHRLGRSQAIAAWRPAVSNEDLTEGEKRTKRQKLSEHCIGLLKRRRTVSSTSGIAIAPAIDQKKQVLLQEKPPEVNS